MFLYSILFIVLISIALEATTFKSYTRKRIWFEPAYLGLPIQRYTNRIIHYTPNCAIIPTVQNFR